MTPIKKNLLEETIKNEAPDIFSITEILTKHNPKITPAELNIEGYDCFYEIENMERGTIIYVKSTLNARKYNKFNYLNFSESTWVTFKSINNEKVLIGCVYRRGKSTNENSSRLNLILKSKFLNDFDKIIIAGDFNYPCINWNESAKGSDEGKDFVETIRDAFLVQHVSKPTRVRMDQKSNILDLVLVRETDDISFIDYCTPIGASDHLLLKITTSLKKTKSINNEKYRANYNKGNFKDFNLYMSDFDWDILLNMSTEEGWDLFKDRLEKGTEKFIPKTKCFKKKPKPLWMNEEAKKAIKRKQLLFKKYLSTKNSIHYKEYIKERNKTTKIIKNLKKKYEHKVAIEAKTNPKAFWQYINSKRKCREGVSSLKKDDGNYTNSDKEKADVLNQLFTSVFTKENPLVTPLLNPGEKSKGNLISNIVIEEEVVKQKLNELNPFKTPGADNIHPKVLKELSNSLAKPLTIIFNKSIENSVLPKDWKMANITAIFKKGDKSSANNYRPVSLTSIVCKILESIIRDLIQEFFESNNLYTACQHGFRSNKSCTSQLLEVVEDFSILIDDAETFDTIYLDFKKAFDSVPHQRLLNKLEAYGVSDKILMWIENFLTDRYQSVNVGSEKSQLSKVTSGIPQGSVLGPILFTIFINDLPDHISTQCKIFADDTKIYSPSRNNNSIQKDLDELQKWSEKWQLPFNTNKCKCMYYGKNNPKCKYYLNDSLIQECSEEKDLGITFDPSLKFNIHINNIINKANQVLGIIRRNFNYLMATDLIKLYKSLVRPHLEYGQSVWSPYLIKNIKSLERVQKRVTKLVPSIKKLSYSERLRVLKLPSLQYRRLRGDLIQVYKMLNKNKSYEYFLKLNTDSRTRCHNYKLYKSSCRVDIRKFTFSRRVVDIWNSLDTETVNARSLNNFKNLLDKRLSNMKYITSED